MSYLGNFAADSTVDLFIPTRAGDGSRVNPSTAFEANDFRLYKNGSATQRSSEAGFTITSPFDSMVGMSVLSIDLSDNTDSGFYAAGNDYTVVAYPDETIDGVSVAEVVARFSIENRFTNVTQINGDATAAANAEAFFDGTGYAGTNNVIPTVTTLTGHTAQTADHTAGIADIPTVSEFNARSLASADYTVVGDLGTVQTGDSFAYLGTNLGAIGANATEAGGTGDHLTAIDLPNQTMNITGNITGNLSGTVGSVTGNVGGIAGTITTLDALDTAQDTQHSTTQGKVDTAQADLDILTGSDGVVLATTQANYAPSKAGDEMDLVDAPNATAITAFATALEAAILNEGDATALLAALAAKVEEFLVNEGDATATLAAISTAVWSETNRTLTANTNFNDPTVAAIADAVLDEVMSGHVTVGTLGKAIADILADSNELQSDNIPGLIAALNNISTAQVNSEVDSALADYDAPTRIELTTDTNSILTRLGTPAGVDIAADIAENNTVVDGIQTDLSNATDGLGALKTLIDNVQTAVDALNDYDGTDTSGITTLLTRLTALRAGYLDALNGHIAQTTDHTTNIAAILIDTAEIGVAGAGLTEAGATGDHLTAVPWNAAWDAEVQSEVTDGLNAYDPPTRAELTTDTNSVLTRLGTPAGADVSADVAAVKVDTGNLVTRITSTLFTGITSLAEWLGLLAGKQAGDSTALTEIAATGAGSGTFDEATDSLEAIRDRGDAEWITGAGGSSPTAADIRAEIDSNSTKLAAIVADTNELQTNQGNWITATGFSTHSAADIWTVATRVLTANTNLNDPTVAAIADAVTDELLSGHTTPGSLGQAISDILVDTGTTLDGKIDTIDGIVDSILVDTGTTLDGKIDNIEADTNELQTNQGNWITATGFSTHTAADVWSVVTRVLTANTNLNDPTVAAIADAVCDEALSGHATAGTLGKAISDVLVDTGTTLDGKIDTIDGIVDSILIDTGTTLDGKLDTAQADLDIITGADGANLLSATQASVDAIETDTDTTVPALIAALPQDKTGYTLAASEDVYHANIQLTLDGANSRDEYTVTWFKNGSRVSSGITSPLVQVVNRSDGTDLVASASMTQIGSTGSYKYDEGTNRLTNGEAALVIVSATIDSGTRSFSKILGRDASS